MRKRLLPLWAQPVDARPDPVAAFGEVYADPVLVNGTELALADLVDRARALQRAFDGLSMQILDIVEAPGRLVVAFLMRGQHTGPFVSPVGTIAPTHRDIEVRTIDVPYPHRGCHLGHLGCLRRARPTAPAHRNQAGMTPPVRLA